MKQSELNTILSWMIIFLIFMIGAQSFRLDIANDRLNIQSAYIESVSTRVDHHSDIFMKQLELDVVFSNICFDTNISFEDLSEI